MKLIKYTLFVALSLAFSGCDELYKILASNETKSEKQYSTPMDKIFQDELDPKTKIITSECKDNEDVSYIYYETPFEAYSNYFEDTKNLISTPQEDEKLKPFWDIRYVNSIEKYVDGDSELNYADLSLVSGIDALNGERNSIAGSDMARYNYLGSAVSVKCIDNKLAAGATINLNDAPEQYLEYAGPQATFMYRLSDESNSNNPWSKDSGNLMMQAYFNKPIYSNFAKNSGASVNFGVFLRNKKNGLQLNYIIGVFSAGDAWLEERKELKYDPTTKIVHVATVARDTSRWSTKSPKSITVSKVYNTYKYNAKKDSWANFFRVNISYNNLKEVLKKLSVNPPIEASGEDFGLNPEDWQVASVYIQYEVEEEGGKALLSGSFKEFEVYSSKLPL